MNTSSSSFIKEGSNSQGIVKPYNSFLPLSPTLLASEQQQSKTSLPFYTAVVYDKRFCLPPIQTTKEENPMRKHSSLPLTHIVSPEAIREAQIEESEDALFNQSRPFSAYPSFSLFKQHPTTTDTIAASSSPPLSSSSLSPPLPPPSQMNEKQQKTDAKEKLKRPPNAYLLFNRDMRRKLLEQSPKMTVGEISKEIGYWWKELPDDQRQFYVKEASLLKQEHLRKYPDFIYTRRSKAELAQAKRKVHSNHSDDDINTDEDEVAKPSTKRKRNNGEKDPRGRKKKKIKNPFAPKHPMSAYLYYLASVYPQVSQRFPGSTVGPISKTISRTWHAMTKEERSPWIEKAESDKARYAREMQVYMSSHQEQQEDEVNDDLDIHALAAVVEMVNSN